MSHNQGQGLLLYRTAFKMKIEETRLTLISTIPLPHHFADIVFLCCPMQQLWLRPRQTTWQTFHQNRFDIKHDNQKPFRSPLTFTLRLGLERSKKAWQNQSSYWFFVLPTGTNWKSQTFCFCLIIPVYCLFSPSNILAILLKEWAWNISLQRDISYNKSIIASN